MYFRYTLQDTVSPFAKIGESLTYS